MIEWHLLLDARLNTHQCRAVVSMIDTDSHYATGKPSCAFGYGFSYDYSVHS